MLSSYRYISHQPMSTHHDLSDSLGYALSHVRQVLQRQFSTMDHDVINDAIATAVERFILKAPIHLRQSKVGAFCWIRTTAINELRHITYKAQRFVSYSEANNIMEALSASENADYLAHLRVLREWLTKKLGPTVAETVWLHEIEHWAPRDIAAAQHLNVASVKARITRSRRILRESVRFIG